MMHDQPNHPEYCQGIYEAAKELIEYCQTYGAEYRVSDFEIIDRIDNLKRALGGKP